MNNGLGINSFSGPMGEKEPAYGVAERMKILSRIGVKSPPAQDAARRSKRAAVRGKRASQTQAAPPPPPTPAPEMQPIANYDQQLAQFWTELAAQPGASPLVQQLAQQVALGG